MTRMTGLLQRRITGGVMISGVGLGPHPELASVFTAVEGEDPRSVTALYDRVPAYASGLDIASTDDELIAGYEACAATSAPDHLVGRAGTQTAAPAEGPHVRPEYAGRPLSGVGDRGLVARE